MNNLCGLTQTLIEFWVDFVKPTELNERNNTPEHLQIFENSSCNLNSINATISKIFCSCPSSYESFVHSVEMVRRIIVLNKDLVITPKNCINFLITSIMVSSKFCDDVCYDNQSYAQIFGISLELINQLEVAFLFSINWNLVLEEGEFEDTLDIIYNRQYGLFYPDVIQNSERVTLTELPTSPTTTTKNLNERILGSELNREFDWKPQEESEITNISPTIIKRNSTNSTNSNQVSSKEKIRLVAHNYFENDYQPFSDRSKYVSSSSYSSSPLSSSPFTDEEQKFLIKTGNYPNEAIFNQINYHPNQDLNDNIDNVFNNDDHKISRKREIPKKYFKDQNLSKNRIKNLKYSKTNHINVSNQYY
ncbi:hypothetical protein M0813_11851 [Anaeramoeba flamelloides]|uniref:Cyclin n=1 Tax=Anaeramoeba flamelloides TaxID=1746091 RepID=A0ABQ8ZDT1_9EUKA|nr:hypothetical protein M0813_11851 [Anaeramoeba flamelloides]